MRIVEVMVELRVRDMICRDMAVEAVRVVSEHEMVVLLTVSLAIVGGNVHRVVMETVVHSRDCAMHQDVVRDGIGHVGVVGDALMSAMMSDGIDVMVELFRVSCHMVGSGGLESGEAERTGRIVATGVGQGACGIKDTLMLESDSVGVVLGVGVGQRMEHSVVVVGHGLHIVCIIVVMVKLMVGHVIGRVMHVGVVERVLSHVQASHMGVGVVHNWLDDVLGRVDGPGLHDVRGVVDMGDRLAVVSGGLDNSVGFRCHEARGKLVDGQVMNRLRRLDNS